MPALNIFGNEGVIFHDADELQCVLESLDGKGHMVDQTKAIQKILLKDGVWVLFFVAVDVEITKHEKLSTQVDCFLRVVSKFICESKDTSIRCPVDGHLIGMICPVVLP